MDILQNLSSRYAVKQFDSAKKISNDLFNQFLDAIVLTPSSYGLQPWKFVVVENHALREKLVEHSWGQKQITEASHLIVFCTVNPVDEKFIDKHIQQTAKIRNIEPSTLDKFKKNIIGDLVTGERSKNNLAWAKNQVYIALGNAMTAAAALQIDTCPIEGFDPIKYDEILNLQEHGAKVAVVLAVGYKDINDKYAKIPKVRFDKKDVVIYL